MPEIFLCIHCSSELKGSGKYCLDCNTAEKRHLMDEENRKHFEKNGLIFQCKHCEKNKVEEIIKT